MFCVHDNANARCSSLLNEVEKEKQRRIYSLSSVSWWSFEVLGFIAILFVMLLIVVYDVLLTLGDMRFLKSVYSQN